MEEYTKNNPIRYQAMDQSSVGMAGVNKIPEVQREMQRLQESSQNLTKLAEELTGRLSSVIAPTVNDGAKMSEPVSSTTPLATNMRDIVTQLHAVERTLRFILQGIEL